MRISFVEMSEEEPLESAPHDPRVRLRWPFRIFDIDGVLWTVDLVALPGIAEGTFSGDLEIAEGPEKGRNIQKIVVSTRLVGMLTGGTFPADALHAFVDVYGIDLQRLWNNIGGDPSVTHKARASLRPHIGTRLLLNMVRRVGSWQDTAALVLGLYASLPIDEPAIVVPLVREMLNFSPALRDKGRQIIEADRQRLHRLDPDWDSFGEPWRRHGVEPKCPIEACELAARHTIPHSSDIPPPAPPLKTMVRTWPEIVRLSGYSRRSILRHAAHLVRQIKTGHAVEVEVCLEDHDRSQPLMNRLPSRLSNAGQPLSNKYFSERSLAQSTARKWIATTDSDAR
jgi:hypothetical protein